MHFLLKSRKSWKSFVILITITILFLCLLYIFNYIPHRKYTNSDFGIDTYISKIDKDNANVVTQIAEKRHEEAKPYELVNKCLNDVTTFINNKDFNVNADYIENGITSFDPIGGEK